MTGAISGVGFVWSNCPRLQKTTASFWTRRACAGCYVCKHRPVNKGMRLSPYRLVRWRQISLKKPVCSQGTCARLRENHRISIRHWIWRCCLVFGIDGDAGASMVGKCRDQKIRHSSHLGRAAHVFVHDQIQVLLQYFGLRRMNGKRDHAIILSHAVGRQKADAQTQGNPCLISSKSLQSIATCALPMVPDAQRLREFWVDSVRNCHLSRAC